MKKITKLILITNNFRLWMNDGSWSDCDVPQQIGFIADDGARKNLQGGHFRKQFSSFNLLKRRKST